MQKKTTGNHCRIVKSPTTLQTKLLQFMKESCLKEKIIKPLCCRTIKIQQKSLCCILASRCQVNLLLIHRVTVKIDHCKGYSKSLNMKNNSEQLSDDISKVYFILYYLLCYKKFAYQMLNIEICKSIVIYHIML